MKFVSHIKDKQIEFSAFSQVRENISIDYNYVFSIVTWRKHHIWISFVNQHINDYVFSPLNKLN